MVSIGLDDKLLNISKYLNQWPSSVCLICPLMFSQPENPDCLSLTDNAPESSRTIHFPSVGQNIFPLYWYHYILLNIVFGKNGPIRNEMFWCGSDELMRTIAIEYCLAVRIVEWQLDCDAVSLPYNISNICPFYEMATLSALLNSNHQVI